MMLPKEKSDLIAQELLKREEISTLYAIKNLSPGYYTKHYDTWKRAQNIIRCFKEGLAKNESQIEVLDIGCDNGVYIFILNSIREYKGKLKFYSIDISPSVICLAEELRNTLGMDNVTFKVGSAEDLKFPNFSFDIVLCAETIEHTQNPEACLKQILRILRPGGLAILTTPNKTNSFLKFKNIFNFLFRDKKLNSHLEATYESKLDYGHISVKGIHEWRTLIKRAGFKVEKMRRGGLFCGGAKYDMHPFLFAVSLILDIILDHLVFALNCTENITFQLRKPYSDKK